MMDNLKTILAIIGLLTIGFVGGFIAQRHFFHQQVEKVSRMGEGQVFKNHLIGRLHPTEEQQALLDPILKEHARSMAQLSMRNRIERQALLTALEAKLAPILDSTQLNQLHQIHQRFGPRERFQEGSRPRRPLREHSRKENLLPIESDSIH